MPIVMLHCAASTVGFWWVYAEPIRTHDLGFWVGLCFSLGMLAGCLLVGGTLLVWNLLAIHWIDRNDSWPEQG